MIKLEVILLTNNIIIPFQDFGLDFVDLNKLFATQSLAEHGLGFLINVYDAKDPEDQWTWELKKKIIFDTGSTNATFLHNVDVRGYTLYDVDIILLSHWHYDHTGALCRVLERIDNEIPIITHDSAKYERFFRRSKGVKSEELVNKKREDILSLLSTSKIVNQAPIDLKHIEELKGNVIFSKEQYEVYKSEELNITLSGEIPRKHREEEFHSFFSLQDDVLKEDQILDDKYLIIEYKDHIDILNGCCHSGLMNTIDDVKSLYNKPIAHIIGGFHMASATEQRIEKTIDFLKNLQKYKDKLFLFPIHCTGEKFVQNMKKHNISDIEIYNPSVGTIFYL